VFEEHLPEATPLYEAAISVGSLVSLKDKEFKEFFRVKQMQGGTLVLPKEMLNFATAYCQCAGIAILFGRRIVSIKTIVPS